MRKAFVIASSANLCKTLPLTQPDHIRSSRDLQVWKLTFRHCVIVNMHRCKNDLSTPCCCTPSSQMENNLTSVERMLEYTELPKEPPLVGDQPGLEPPKGWPSCGALVYEHVSATYRPSLPPVLRNICFQLKGGSTCGVVGRTGSGKVSFFCIFIKGLSLLSLQRL